MLLCIAALVVLLGRLVIDGWLELTFVSSEVGQQVVAALQTLRNTWTHLLELKLEASKSRSSIECFSVLMF